MSDDVERIKREVKEEFQREAIKKKARADKVKAMTKYRAVVNIDFSYAKQNEYQRLLAAMMQMGWKYLETSALSFEGDLPNILVAMELINKHCQSIGTLSALTFHIQGSTNLNGKEYPQSKSFKYALTQLREKPLVKPSE